MILFGPVVSRVEIFPRNHLTQLEDLTIFPYTIRNVLYNQSGGQPAESGVIYYEGKTVPISSGQ